MTPHIEWVRREHPANYWRAGWEARLGGPSGLCIAIVYLEGDLFLVASNKFVPCGSHAIAAALVERGAR